VTEQIVGAPVDDLLREQQDEIARLGRLVEAAGRLLETLDVEAVLPEVLELAKATLAADAYALWRRDDADGGWSLQATANLSPEYVRKASEAIVGNENVVTFDGPILAEDIAATEWLTESHRAAHAAEGNRAFAAIPLFHRGEVSGTLVFYYRSAHAFTDSELRAARAVGSLAAAAIGTAADYQRQARLAEDRRLIAEASEVLSSSLDYETTLANVAQLVVPRFADWCVVDVARDDGSIDRLAVAHADPAKAALARELSATMPLEPDAPTGVAHVIRTGEPQVASEIPPELLEERWRDRPDILEALLSLGLRSAMIVPLVSGGRTFGAITFVAAESGRRYTDADLVDATDLARRAAAAVDNARLYSESVLRETQVRFLAEAGTILNETLDYDDTLARLVRLAVPQVADWCIVDVVEGAEIRRVAVAAQDPEKQAALELLRDHYPPTWDSPQPAAHALRERGPVIFSSFGGDELESTVRDERHLGIMRTLAPTSAVAMPLFARGETVGAITFAWSETGRQYSERDVPLMEDLAQRAALAVENARVYERERATGNQLAFLAEMSALLAVSLDYETTMTNVAQLVVPQFADWCAVDVVDDDGSLQRIAVVHKDPERAEWAKRSRESSPPAPDEQEGSARVIRTGEPILYRRITDELLRETADSPEQLEVLRGLGMASAMVVPMKARGRTLGALTLVSSTEATLYDDDALTFAEHLGRRAAAAVDNALLFRRAEERAQSALALAFVGDGVVLLGDDDVVRVWNTAAEVITGLPAAGLVGRPIQESLPGWSAVERHVPLASGPGTPRAETVPMELGGNERWLSISGVSFPGGTVYAFRDLTEERRVERLKSEFVSTISHELRTPLAAIYGAALTLRREDASIDAQRDGLLEVVASESERLARIVNDILWVSRLESGTLHVDLQHCDAADLARSVVASAKAHLPETTTVEIEVEQGVPPVAADPDKLRQILTNLLDNAIKYSPDGGAVRVEVRQVENCVEFAVSDQGLGIPAAEQGRIFEKFYRLDPELTRGVGGTGLGLYITRELARRMDGRVTVAPNAPRGSTFRVELPMAR
jgi:GAF domain-containing protein